MINIGVVSYGLYIPDGFETADAVAEKSGLTVDAVKALGIERKFIPATDDQPVTMAVKAAKQAFKGARDIKPLDVDVVLWTGEEHKDYIAQTASIRLQEEVGCCNAWAFDLVGQGVTSILGLRVARDLMIGDQTVNTVLLAMINRSRNFESSVIMSLVIPSLKYSCSFAPLRFSNGSTAMDGLSDKIVAFFSLSVFSSPKKEGPVRIQIIAATKQMTKTINAAITRFLRLDLPRFSSMTIPLVPDSRIIR